MNMSNFTVQDWSEFRSRYPQADYFLVKRGLYREYQALKRELARDKFDFPPRKTWVENRIKDLETFGIPEP